MYDINSLPVHNLLISNMAGSRGSTIGVVSRLQDGQTRKRGSFPGRRKRYSSRVCRLALGGNPASEGDSVISPGLKRSARKFGHSSSFSAEVRHEWSCTSGPVDAFVACPATTLRSCNTNFKADAVSVNVRGLKLLRDLASVSAS